MDNGTSLLEAKGIDIIDGGIIDYCRGWELQRQAMARVRERSVGCVFILCEHLPVITVGRRGNRNNIVASAAHLRAAGITVHEVDRGGDVTYHGPGQLVIYPICDLSRLGRDIHLFIRNLERLAIGVLAELGVASERREGLTGVWRGNKKLSSIGIAVSRWITYHGMAVNIHEKVLENFLTIRPCGMDVEMSSVESLAGVHVPMECVKELITRRVRNDHGAFAGNG